MLEDTTTVIDKMAEKIFTAATTHQIAEIAMQCQPLRNSVKPLFLNDVNEQCQKLCNESADNSSVLLSAHAKHKVS